MGNEQFRRRLIIALRVFALFTAIASVTAVARAMNALPWVVDGLLALAAAAAFSFWFDRDDWR
ncbi:MAG: hypothetical protein LC804_16970 [Acidobacteria bacterium]|nr:hypothetical protein [Acidobacteriota bacterium]